MSRSAAIYRWIEEFNTRNCSIIDELNVLLINGIPVNCINQAAIQYHVPATLIVSVLKIENGQVGDANPNLNGTVDYGPMQINSIWLPEISRYGYSAELIQYDPCANVAVGAWILSQSIASGADLWQGVGNYHSHTFSENLRYRDRVRQFYFLLKQYLSTANTTSTKNKN